jgi:hypothetical protein
MRPRSATPDFRDLWISRSPAPVGWGRASWGDRLEVGVQVDLDLGPVGLGELDVVGGARGGAGVLDLADGRAGEDPQGGGPRALEPGAADLAAVAPGQAAAVVVEVAGAVLTGPGATVVGDGGRGGADVGRTVAVVHRAGGSDAADQQHQPRRGSNDPLAAQSHPLASWFLLVLGGFPPPPGSLW